MNKLLPAFVACATLSAPSAFSQSEVNVEAFLGMCKQPENHGDRAYCVGYFTGMAQMMEQIGVRGSGEFRHLYGMCIPQGPAPSGNALARAFIVWAEQHPKGWSLQYQMGGLLALTYTWPCPEK